MAGFKISFDSDVVQVFKFLDPEKTKKTKVLMQQISGEIKGHFKRIFSPSQRGRLNAPEQSWADLKDSTKEQKERRYGRVYPTLYAKGNMAHSFYNFGESGHVESVNDTKAEVGSDLLLAKWHQDGTKNRNGTKKMDARPIVYESKTLNDRLGGVVNGFYQSLLRSFKFLR